MMLLTASVMYVDGGDGGGAGDGGAGDGGAGGDAGDGGAGGETLLAGKYKTQEELVNGYTELQTAFSGKDEAHVNELNALKSPEEFKAGEDWSNDNPMDNRMMSVFQEVAKEHNMPQGMYESLVNGMTEMQTRVQEEQLLETKKSIPNFDTRANAIADTALRFLRPDQAQGLDTLMQTKESFEAIEILMGQLRGGALPANTQPPQDMSEAELRKEIRELNPADTTKRAELLTKLNERGGGKGTLV